MRRLPKHMASTTMYGRLPLQEAIRGDVELPGVQLNVSIIIPQGARPRDVGKLLEAMLPQAIRSLGEQLDAQ